MSSISIKVVKCRANLQKVVVSLIVIGEELARRSIYVAWRAVATILGDDVNEHLDFGFGFGFGFGFEYSFMYKLKIKSIFTLLNTAGNQGTYGQAPVGGRVGASPLSPNPSLIRMLT